MPEEPLAFDHSKLSPRDLEILRAFHANNDFETQPHTGEEATAPLTPQPVDPTLDLEDEMIAVFATELNEDLAVLRGGLEQAERDEAINSAGFPILQQVAHKIRGSAAMIGCDAMSTIAHYIELVVQQITDGQIGTHIGLYGLGHAVGAMEMTLESVVTRKQEDLQPLLDLEQDFETLGISLAEQGEEGTNPASTLGGLDASFTRSQGAIDQLVQHTERLIEQQTALEHARKQVDEAFQELQTAQARLRRIEAFFSSIFLSAVNSSSDRTDNGTIPTSSLVARILREDTQRAGRVYSFKANEQPLSLEDATRWDELEMDRFSETHLLAYALNEAIGDISTATAQLQRALAHLDALMGQQITTTQQVHAGFIQHFPQATRLVTGLLVRAWEQQVIIPFAQVLRIDYQGQNGYDQFYLLNSLLDFPATPAALASSTIPALEQAQHVLRLSTNIDTGLEAQIGVQVDEVLGQVELLTRMPPAPLQRPGITGMAIDSTGNVLLVLDVHELIWQDRLRQKQAPVTNAYDNRTRTARHSTPKILIVDDSVSIRRTIRQTLGQKDYALLEASDGREALEKIEKESPDLLLLDLEMPRMNGYDVLNVLRTRSLLPDLKIVLLTSRTSNKHKQRAHELGAHRYLTKPCSDDILLATVAMLLQ